MTTVIEFPDVELIAVDHLRDALPDITIYSSVPTTRSDGDELLVVRRQPGGAIRSLVLQDAVIHVGAWARDDIEAADLARRASAVLWTLPGSHDEGTVYRVRDITGQGNDPDDLSWTPRTTFTLEVTVRGEQIDLDAS